ncbi:MAG TPA: molybdate ABC transporter substrate-binding protein [Bryobacteraceae bacterium]|nr:molybdate ABC transporter substrate-binding protein [Bryobacteraceae bacterium]
MVRGPSAIISLAAIVLGTACGHHAPAGKLSIAAAADLQFALAAGAQQFREKNPQTELAINYGSSGNFSTQIRNGAPFDIYLSADIQYPRALARDGLTAGSVFTYATGKIAVWVTNSSKLDPATALRDPAVRRIAIANPQHAPYGRAAEAALHSLGIYESVEKKLVLGENISQTLQFIQSGAADTGIVALSLALAPSLRGQGRYWQIPASAYPKIEQGGVIVKDSAAARQFRLWLLSPSGQALLREYGFSPADE